MSQITKDTLSSHIIISLDICQYATIISLHAHPQVVYFDNSTFRQILFANIEKYVTGIMKMNSTYFGDSIPLYMYTYRKEKLHATVKFAYRLDYNVNSHLKVITKLYHQINVS